MCNVCIRLQLAAKQNNRLVYECLKPYERADFLALAASRTTISPYRRFKRTIGHTTNRNTAAILFTPYILNRPRLGEPEGSPG